MKKHLLYTLFALCFVAAHSQDAVRVFRSERDAEAFQKNEEALHRLNFPRDTVKADSLFQIANRISDNSFLGWKYTYHPTPSYTGLQQLTTQNLDAEKITNLSISDYEGSKLPAALFSCTNLEELELINTRLKKIPRKLDRLTKLRTLSIYNNQSQRPLVLKKNHHVGFLKIRSAQPRQCPSRYTAFAALDSLDLARNFLTAFPKISAQEKLTKLTLNENNLTLEKLRVKPNRTLEVLYLRRNKIEVVPDAIGNFKALKNISLNHNRIREITKGIANLQRLQVLSLYQNKLTSIPSPIYSLTHLKEVDLYFNEIEKIEDQIKSLSNLEKLYLANNKIYALSENIGTLPSLRELYLHHNRISFFPNSFSHLVSLRILRLNDNFFAEFPDQILQMTDLENLDISRNRIQSIPELSALHQLKLLVLTENPWENPERVRDVIKEVRDQGTFVQFSPTDDEVEEVVR